MTDYEEIEAAKEIILTANDDDVRSTKKTANSIFSAFNVIVEDENKKGESNEEGTGYLDEFRKLKAQREKKTLKKEISDKESMLLNAFGITDANEINNQDFLSKTSGSNIRKRKSINEKYLDKNSDKKDGNDQLYAIFKRLYNKNLVLHGEKQRNGGVRPKADVDGQSSMLLLKLCGFFKDDEGKGEIPNIDFVANGDGLSKGLHLDTNKTLNGIKVEKKKGVQVKEDEAGNEYSTEYETLFNSSATLDEHGTGLSSTTHIVYTLLKELGKIPKKYEKQMERFVDFVDIVDSKYYSIAGADFDDLHHTIVGLHRNLPISYVYNYFADTTNTGFEILSDKYMSEKKNDVNMKVGKKFYKSLKDVSDQKLTGLNKAKAQYDFVDQKSQFLTTGKGKFSFVIDAGAKINYCAQVAEYNGRGCFRLFPNGDVYIYGTEKLPENIGGNKTQGPFLIKNMNREEFNKFLKEFDFNKNMEGKENILNDIDTIYKNLENKENDRLSKQNQKEMEDGIFLEKVLKLPKIDKIEENKEYKGIVDGTPKYGAFVWLDKTHKGLLHKSKISPQILKGLSKGDDIVVKVIDMTNGDDKLQFAV